MIALYHMVLSESLGQSMVPTSVPALIKTSVGSPADQLECKLTPRRGEAKRSRLPFGITYTADAAQYYIAQFHGTFGIQLQLGWGGHKRSA
jgi:hypothetical protein